MQLSDDKATQTPDPPHILVFVASQQRHYDRFMRDLADFQNGVLNVCVKIINANENLDLCRVWKIQRPPTSVLLKDGQEVYRIEGGLHSEFLIRTLEYHDLI